jgi:hypothetical protein
MIDDMASLKQAMEQMDADDAAVAQAAKDRTAQILSDAGLSFSQLGDLIEQQRLMLRPKIVASIKRIDQPGSLGDASFRDSSASLRREGQSFRQIAEALELRGATALRYEPSVDRGLLTQREDKPDVPQRQRSLPLILRVLLYPFRHPLQILAIAALAVVLVNGLRELAGTGRQTSVHPPGGTAVQQQADAVSPSPTPPSPIPPNASADQTSPASSDSPAEPSAPSTANVRPAANADARSASPPTSGMSDRARTVHPRSISDFMPEQLRRRSRLAGPCRTGIGGCYWGGGQY